MPKNNDTTTSFKVDISELKKSMQEAKRQVSVANSEFKAVSSTMEDWTKSSDGLSAKLKQLDSNLKSQKTILSNLEAQYELTVKEMGEGSKAADDLKIKINNQKAAINKTEREINEYEASLEEVTEAEKKAAKTGKTVAEVLGDIEQESKDAGDGFTVMKGVMSNLATAGINFLADAFKNLCSTIKESYEAYDEGADIIIQKTGAVGEAATSLQNSYKKVSKSVVGEFSDIGTAIGEVNTRFGLTGDELEDLTTKFLKFSELNGTDVNSSIDSVQKTLAAFGLESKDAGSVLDTMNKVGQDTGVSMGVLSNLLMENASSFSQMGLDVHQAAVFLGDIEKSGVSTSVAMTSLSKASQYAAEENKPLTEVLKETTKKMKNAKTDAEGLQVAYDVFGKKAGAKIYEACKNGSLSFDDLSKAMKNNSGSINETYEATQDGMDKIKLAVQGAKADVGDAIASFLDEHKDDVVEAIETVTTKVKKFFKFVTDNGDTIIGLLSGIAAGFVAFKVANVIMSLVKAFKLWKAATEGMTIAQRLLNLVMNANPIGIVIALITGLVAAFVVLWKKSDKFRNFWINLWNKVKSTTSTVISAIANFFTKTIPNAINKTVTFFSALPNKISKWLNNALNKVVNWGSNLASKGKEAGKKLLNAVVNKVKELPKKITSYGKDVVSGLWNGMSDKVAWLKKKIKSFVGDVKDWLKKFFKIGSPSKLMRDEIGRWLPEGIAVGIDKNAKSVLSSMRNLAVNTLGAAKDTISSTTTTLSSAGVGGGVTNNFYQTINSPKQLSRLDIYRQSKNLLGYAGGGH